MTDLVERLQDDAAQLTRSAANAKLAGGETYVRVYDPAILTKDLTEAASRISQQDAELERLRREVEEVKAEVANWRQAFAVGAGIDKEPLS